MESYSLSKFEIRGDVKTGRLRISGELPLNAGVVNMESRKTCALYGYSSEILGRVTSCLISKLDRE